MTALAQERALEHLRKKQGFIWNATNTTRALRHGLITLFTAYHARIRIVYVEIPWSDLLARNSSRPKPVPESVITKLAYKLELPSLTAAHEVDFF